MSSAIALFPEALLSADRLKEVEDFLLALPVPPRRKKQALVEWTQVTGVALTREMVEAVLGPLADQVIG